MHLDEIKYLRRAYVLAARGHCGIQVKMPWGGTLFCALPRPNVLALVYSYASSCSQCSEPFALLILRSASPGCRRVHAHGCVCLCHAPEGCSAGLPEHIRRSSFSSDLPLQQVEPSKFVRREKNTAAHVASHSPKACPLFFW